MATDVSHLPEFLRPKLRIFLSADLVGSTNVKQYPRFPITDVKKFWETSPLVPSWLSPIADFYANFGEVFRNHWTALKRKVNVDYKGISITSDPVLWKANGDELLYYKDVRNRQELFLCVLAWKTAVLEYRQSLRSNGPLDIKSTLWTAGFPITNVEIVFESSLEPTQRSQFPDDARLQQVHLLSRFYEEEESGSSDLLLDFLGPTIDTGFRLATKATPRRMVLSADLAYLLATTHLPDETDQSAYLRWFKVRYDGRAELKGVLGGKPYPIFWIDMHEGEPLATAEDELLRSSNNLHLEREKVAAFCNAFYADTSSLMMKPFIVYEPDNQYAKIPENYIACLNHLHDRWKAERERYEAETRALEGQAPSEGVEQELASPVNVSDPIKMVLSKAEPH